MRNRNAIVFLWIWEHLYNPDFKGAEFDTFNKSWIKSVQSNLEKWLETHLFGHGIINQKHPHTDKTLLFQQTLLYLIHKSRIHRNVQDIHMRVDWWYTFKEEGNRENFQFFFNGTFIGQTFFPVNFYTAFFNSCSCIVSFEKEISKRMDFGFSLLERCSLRKSLIDITLN